MRPCRFADPPAACAASSLPRMAFVFARRTFASDGARSPAPAPPTAPSTAISWRLTPANPRASVKTQPTVESHVSSVHMLPSSQWSAVPKMQVPVAVTQVSVPLHLFPSSQPRESLQRQTGCPASRRHDVPGLVQVNGATSVQTPLMHARPRHRPPQSVSALQGMQSELAVSFRQPESVQVSVVQALWSSHSPTLWQQRDSETGRCTQPFAASQTSSVHGSSSLSQATTCGGQTPSASQQQALRARIVLRAAEGATNTQIAAEAGVSLPTVGLWRRSFSERGLDGLADAPRRDDSDRRPRPPHTPAAAGASDAPAGRGRARAGPGHPLRAGDCRL